MRKDWIATTSNTGGASNTAGTGVGNGVGNASPPNMSPAPMRAELRSLIFFPALLVVVVSRRVTLCVLMLLLVVSTLNRKAVMKSFTQRLFVPRDSSVSTCQLQ